MPGERWLTILMNRIDPALFSAAFTAWVRTGLPVANSLTPKPCDVPLGTPSFLFIRSRAWRNLSIWSRTRCSRLQASVMSAAAGLSAGGCS